MSLSRAVVQAAKALVNTDPIGSHVREQYVNVMEGSAAGAPDEYKCLLKFAVPFFGACATEGGLLEHSDLLIQQLEADGKPMLPVEVRTRVIEEVRDIKIGILEADGCVNPMDAMSIKVRATSWRQRARALLLTARSYGTKREPTGAVFDRIELQMLRDAYQKCDGHYHDWMRSAQAAIWAVAELRLQYLTK